MSGRARERLPWPPRSVLPPSLGTSAAAAREKWAAISRPNVSPILYGLLELGARTSPTRRTSSRHERKKGTAAATRTTTTLFVLHLNSLRFAFRQQHPSFFSPIHFSLSVRRRVCDFIPPSVKQSAVAKGPALPLSSTPSLPLGRSDCRRIHCCVCPPQTARQ